MNRKLVMVCAGLLFAGAAAVLLAPRLLGPRLPALKPVRSDLVQTVVTTGRVMAPAEIDISAGISAEVLDVRVDKGDRVSKGDILVRLDDKDALVAVAQAKATLARARAKRRQVRNVSAKVLDESLAQAEARRDESQRRYTEDEKLYASGAIAKSELDRSRTQLDVAKSQLSAAKVQADAARPGGADAESAHADLALAEAELRAANVRLERTVLRAPVDGVVLNRSVEPGELAAPGRVVLTLARTGLTQLLAEPDEKNLSLLTVGQAATASAEAYASDRFDAKVSFIAPSVDPRRGTVELRLEVPKPPSYLRPAMTVSIEIQVAERKNALVIDADAIHELGGDSPWVMVVRGDHATRQNVRLGIRGDVHVEILEGLDEGSTVLEANAAVSAGSRVRVAGGA